MVLTCCIILQFSLNQLNAIFYFSILVRIIWFASAFSHLISSCMMRRVKSVETLSFSKIEQNKGHDMIWASNIALIILKGDESCDKKRWKLVWYVTRTRNHHLILKLLNWPIRWWIILDVFLWVFHRIIL